MAAYTTTTPTTFSAGDFYTANTVSNHQIRYVPQPIQYQPAFVPPDPPRPKTSLDWLRESVGEVCRVGRDELAVARN